ncbi:hypothetical protein VTH82DRAFT_8683 [Thermothelomyces myriococcoides]
MDPPPPPTKATSSPQSTTSTQAVSHPRLAVLSPSKSHPFQTPSKKINTGADLSHFLSSLAYRDIGLFILQLNRALCPRKEETPSSSDAPAESSSSSSSSSGSSSSTATNTIAGGRFSSKNEARAKVRTFRLDTPRPADPETVVRLRELLRAAEAIIEEAPPEQGPRRFGNVSFRRWYAILESRADELLQGCLPDAVREAWGGGAVGEVKAYFLGAFGSAQRLDYGTGHELSFLAFLGCLWKLGAFRDDQGGGREDGEVERSVVFGVFEPYLKVVRRLILTYNLEPAGSHGVWGLDDHSFLPYIFGSAQLTRPITESEPMPQEGSVPGAPRPSDVVKPASVDLHRESNMYFSAIGFINDVKKGPFWEHSPILFDVSGIKDGWGKINKGMIKMFNAEVLSKFPVVQHFPFGSLFSWDPDPEAAVPAHSVHLASQPSTATPPAAAAAASSGSGTAAQWAEATKMPGAAPGVPPGPGIPYSRAPWTRGGGSAPTAPRGGVPNTGPPPPTTFARGTPGTASNQYTVTKAPWAKD